MIADIITGGFGTFSSVYKIPTRGFWTGTSVVILVTPGCVSVYDVEAYDVSAYDVGVAELETYNMPVCDTGVYRLPSC